MQLEFDLAAKRQAPKAKMAGKAGRAAQPAEAPPPAAPPQPAPALSLRARLRAAKAERAVKRAAALMEPTKRGPVTKIVAGPRGSFIDEQLAGFDQRIRDAWPGLWLVMFEGKRYRDVDQAGQEETARRIVGHLKCAFPDAAVEWLA